MQYTIVADTGASIIKLLKDNLAPEPVQNPDMIGLCSPYDKGDFVLCLHLYDVQENGENRLVDMETLSSDKQKYPPLSLTLFYMMTVISNEEIATRSLNEQRIFGKAIQVLYDNPILTGGSLVGAAAENYEPINIIPNNMTFEEKSILWNFQNSPYRMSVFYKAAPIYVASTRIRQARRVVETNYSVKKNENIKR